MVVKIVRNRRIRRGIHNADNQITRKDFIIGGLAAVLLLSETAIYDSHNGKKEKGITLDEIAQIDGVSEVKYSRGENPDVIFIAQNHPLNQELLSENIKFETAPSIERICDALYSRYNVRSISLEGIDDFLSNVYVQTGWINPKGAQDEITRKAFEFYNRILSKPGHGWDLYVGEAESVKKALGRLKEPIKKIQNSAKQKIDEEFLRLLNAKNYVYSSGNFVFDTDIGNLYNELYSRYGEQVKQEINNYLTNDIVDELYRYIYTERDNSFTYAASRCKFEGKGPLIIVLGATHSETIRSAFESQGLNYAVVIPEGLDKTVNLRANNDTIGKMFSTLSIGGSGVKELILTENGFGYKE